MDSITILSFPPLPPSPELPRRWIGFDMDDCIGNVMPASRFAKVFKPKPVAEAICAYEMCGETWLLRPGMTEVVSSVAQAYKAYEIEGAFLYSNNSSVNTVEFARALMNKIAEELHDVRPFRVGFHRGTASRSSASDKNFSDICNMLHCADLPTPTSPADIIFFDDQFHPLATEISHYHRVPKYSTWTSIDKVIAALESLCVSDPEMYSRASLISYIDQDEQKNPVVTERPSVDNAVINIFLEGIQKFLHPPPVMDD